MKFRIDQPFTGVPLDRFVEIYFSEAFNEAVAPVSGMKERRLVHEERRADGTLFRRVRLVPAVPIPKVLESVIAGRQVAYDEVCIYDPRAHEARYHIEHKAGDRLRVQGIIRFQEREGAVHRVVDGEVEVRIFGLGTVVERFVESEVRKGYDKIAAFLQRYIDDVSAGPS